MWSLSQSIMPAEQATFDAPLTARLTRRQRARQRQCLAEGIHTPSCPLFVGDPPDPNWTILAAYAQGGPCPHRRRSQRGQVGEDLDALDYTGPALFDVAGLPLAAPQAGEPAHQRGKLRCPLCGQRRSELRAVANRGRGRPRPHQTLTARLVCASCHEHATVRISQEVCDAIAA